MNIDEKISPRYEVRKIGGMCGTMLQVLDTAEGEFIGKMYYFRADAEIDCYRMNARERINYDN